VLFFRLGRRGVLTAVFSLFVFPAIVPAQSGLVRGDLPATVQTGRSLFSTQPCPAADFEPHLRLPGLRGNSDLTVCGASPGDVPDSIPCTSGPNQVSTCEAASDSATQTALTSLGKKRKSVSAARAKVLEILDADNACSAWFRRLEPDPAHTFRTLSFAMDEKATDYVIERIEGSNRAFVNPYVATVVQSGGEFQAVTLNAGGAFFRAAATLIRLAKEGGPVQFQGARMLKVGPYMGNTLNAQSTTLLHELGHVIGLLPLDTNDANGQSAANTREVLRHCQPEIESATKHHSLSKSR
jgi:hypothetical protein